MDHNSRKRKAAQGPVNDDNMEAGYVHVDPFEHQMENFFSENEYITTTTPEILQANRSPSSGSLFNIAVSIDESADVNVPNVDALSGKTDRAELFVAENEPSAVIGSRTGRPPVQLYLTCDDDAMSQYQCFVRKQIELFEADFDDVTTNAQGRNKPIIMGQVGIRCRYCNMLPPNQRKRGAIYYPSKLDGVYQAANNLAISHLGEHCQSITEQFRNHLTTLRSNLSIGGGGKKVWSERAAALGVFEDSNGLRFEPSINYRQRNYLEI